LKRYLSIEGKLSAHYGISPEAAELLTNAGCKTPRAVDALSKTALGKILPKTQRDKIVARREAKAARKTKAPEPEPEKDE